MTEFQFSKTVEFRTPTRIIFGINASAEAGKQVQILGGTKALIVTDKVLSQMNAFGPVVASLDAAGIPHVIFDGVLPNAPVRLVLQALELLKREQCDVVIGVGGGSSMDTAKAVSLLATNGATIDSLLGAENVKKAGLPKITVPTTNVAGADSSSACILTVDETTRKHGVIASHFAMPDAVIVDPLLTVSMPPAVTADTGIDVLVTAIESYTSPKANLFSDIFGEKIIELCGKYLPVACAKGSNIEARYHMAFCSTASGPLFMTSSLGAFHGLSQTVAEELHLSHGRSLAVLMTPIMRFNLPGNPERFSRIANLLGKSTAGLSPLEGAELAVQAVEEILNATGGPYRLRDYGLIEDDVTRLAEASFEASRGRSLPNNSRDITVDDVRAIFKAAF